MSGPPREVLLVAHTGRRTAIVAARDVAARLAASGTRVRVLADEADDLAIGGAHLVPPGLSAAAGCGLVLVLGGDGTVLRAAEMARHGDVPMIGVNLGHVGFLAEAEPGDLDDTVDRLLAGDYVVEERLTLDVEVRFGGRVVHRDWALNEASVEKAARERMIEVVAEVDGRPLSRWGCDGIVLATPTGSTAYSFSAGGPIVAPGVQALLLVPISAHALFARPVVVGTDATLAVEVVPTSAPGVLTCDGRRVTPVPPGSRVEVRCGRRPVRLARVARWQLIERLVARFRLPVQGWRGRQDE